jgi:hypothetical protein
MGALTNLPTELILIVVRQLRNIEDFLALRSTCRRTYHILSENTAPHTILDLLAASAPTFCSPHPYFLVAALARQTSEWALADPAARIPPLRKAFRGGIDALFAFCLEHAPRGLTLDEIQHLHSLRFSVLNPLTDAIDRMAGPQYNATPDFWEGGVSEPNTLYTEPSRATMQILIYGELFGTSFDHFLDRPLRFADTSVPASPASLSPPPSASSSVSFFSTSSDPRLPKEYPVFTIQDRLDFVKYCIPDWNCSAWGPFEVDRIGPYQVREVEGDHTSNLPADQTALRHVLTCRRWRRMWREGMAKVDKDDFSPPPPTRRLSIISIMSYEDRSSPSRPTPEDLEPRAHHWADHFSWVGDEGETDIPNLSTENWRQKLYRDALVFQGIEGMQLITLPTHKISPHVLEKARWIRQKISELQVPIEMTTFGRLTPMLVSSAPDLSQELWLGVRGRWRASVNV